MRTNKVKSMLKRDLVTLGCWVTIGSGDVAEILSNLGFDWLLFDTEHSPLSLETIQYMIQATSATEIVPLVRVAANDMTLTKRALDIGAYGVIVPLVNNKDDAKRAVSYTRYPPRGIRGAGPRRCAQYGLRTKEYFEWAEEEILTIVQVETEEAVANIDDILSVEGIDVFFIGPTDLSTSLGVPGELNNPKYIRVVERLLESGKEHSVPAGIMTYNVEQAKDAVQRGFKFVSLAADFRNLILGTKTMLQAVAEKDQFENEK